MSAARNRPGSKDHHAKLTEEDVKRILLDPRRAPQVAEQYGVSESAIRRIRTGKSWKHVPRPKNMPTWKGGRPRKSDAQEEA